MKKVIKRARQSLFRNSLHFEFFTGIFDLFSALAEGITHISELIKRLGILITQEDEALDQLRMYEHTDEIHTYDQARDNLFYGMRDVIRRNRKHLNPVTAQAAKSLHTLFEQFKTAPRMPLPEETGALHQLLQHLGKQSDDVKQLGLTNSVAELRELNNDLREFTKERDSEAAQRVHNHVKTVRSEVDAVYSDILSRIEAAFILEGAEKYTTLINEINNRADSYKNIYAREKGNNSKTAENRQQGDVSNVN